jgi:ribosomal protein S27AE
MTAPLARERGIAVEARSINCPHCGQGLKITDEHVNRKITCGKCGKKINLVAGPPPKSAKTPKVPEPPPVPSSAHPWQLHVHGRNVGPFGADTVRDQLKAGKISLDTLAWKEGMDDWKPLGEIPELRGTPSPAAAKPKLKPKDKPTAQAKEHRHRYVPGRAGKDVVTGAWIAIGLGVILLVAVLIIMNQPEPEPEPPKKPRPGPQIIVRKHKSKRSKSSGPKTTKDGKPLPRAARLSREKLIGEVKAGIDRRFREAIAAHKIGDMKPITYLPTYCKRWADDLTAGGRDWGVYKTNVDTLVERLNRAHDDIEAAIPTKCAGWDMGDGISLKDRAESLGFNNVGWLETWRDNLNEALQRLHDQGIDF